MMRVVVCRRNGMAQSSIRQSVDAAAAAELMMTMCDDVVISSYGVLLLLMIGSRNVIQSS